MLAVEVSCTDRSHVSVSDAATLGVDLALMQRDQYRHDMRNHFDILALHKHDRLKHYGLHFAKYVGRIARGPTAPKGLSRTVIDTLLVCLSAANTLHQDLGALRLENDRRLEECDLLSFFADAAGRFADACEKIDHLEEFTGIARAANLDILRWALYTARQDRVDLVSEIEMRRDQLARRQFFIVP